MSDSMGTWLYLHLNCYNIQHEDIAEGQSHRTTIYKKRKKKKKKNLTIQTHFIFGPKIQVKYKVRFYIWGNYEGVIHYKLVSDGQTIDANLYSE